MGTRLSISNSCWLRSFSALSFRTLYAALKLLSDSDILLSLVCRNSHRPIVERQSSLIVLHCRSPARDRLTLRLDHHKAAPQCGFDAQCQNRLEGILRLVLCLI